MQLLVDVTYWCSYHTGYWCSYWWSAAGSQLLVQLLMQLLVQLLVQLLTVYSSRVDCHVMGYAAVFWPAGTTIVRMQFGPR